MMDYLKQPVFEVGNINEKDINLSLPPTSGEEYIKRVILEAQQCADIVVADIDLSRMKLSRGCVKTLGGCVQAPPNLSPTLEWQQYQVSDFSDIRLYVSQLKDEIQVGKRKWRLSDVHLPKIDDQIGWIHFCQDNKEKIEPTLNTLFCFNQSTVEQVLEHLVHFVELEKRIEYKIGQWIYTLLAILEQPLQPERTGRAGARGGEFIHLFSSEILPSIRLGRSLRIFQYIINLIIHNAM